MYHSTLGSRVIKKKKKKGLQPVVEAHVLAAQVVHRIAGARHLLVYGVGFTEMCSGSEAGSYLRLIDFVYHSTLGLRVLKKRRRFRF